MNNGQVSEKRLQALVILKKEELELDRFKKLMWTRTAGVKFARNFLDGLVKLGYVNRRSEKDSEFYAVTVEGEEALVRAMCGYCGVKRWASKLAVVPCRTCKKDHWACPKCSREKVVVVGDFPKYRPALKECPNKG